MAGSRIIAKPTLGVGSIGRLQKLLVSSLSGNLRRFGMKKVTKMESLQEIIAETANGTKTTIGPKLQAKKPLRPYSILFFGAESHLATV